MIQIIGLKRLIILFVFVVFNVVFGAAIYFYMIPESASLDQESIGLRGRVGTVQADIGRIQVEFDQLERQQEAFNFLKDKGFFSKQTRNEVKKLFSDIQDESKVLSAVVSVKSGSVVNYEEVEKANYAVLLSPIEVDIKAFSDVDIYTYLDMMSDLLPGHLSLDEVEIERTQDVTPALLRMISYGVDPEMITASVKLSWRTIIPQTEDISDGQSL